MTAKEYPIAFKAGTIKMMPLATSSPATRNDLCFHDITNAAVANPIAARLSTGVGPTLSTTATFPIALITTKASVAAASPTANKYHDFAMAHIRLDIF